MGNFPGGSPWAMARDMGDGYLLPTERTFSRFEAAELDQIGFELERILRDARGAQPPLDDLPAIQQRNRKIQRLNQGLLILRSYQQRKARNAAPPPSQRPGGKPMPGKPTRGRPKLDL